MSAGTSRFAPADLDVLVGDNVIWRNNSVKTHNVKSEAEGYNSGRIAPRAAANHIFASAGSFAYVCTIHDGMTGEIGVHPLLLSGPKRPVQRGASVALHVRAPEGIVRGHDRGRQRRRLPAGGRGGPARGRRPRGPCRAGDPARQRGGIGERHLSRRLRGWVQPGAARGGDRRRHAVGRGEAQVRRRPAGQREGEPGVPGRERRAPAEAARALRLVAGGARPPGQALARAFTVRRYGGVPARVVMVGADWASPLSQSRVFRLSRRTPR